MRITQIVSMPEAPSCFPGGLAFPCWTAPPPSKNCSASVVRFHHCKPMRLWRPQCGSEPCAAFSIFFSFFSSLLTLLPSLPHVPFVSSLLPSLRVPHHVDTHDTRMSSRSQPTGGLDCGSCPAQPAETRRESLGRADGIACSQNGAMPSCSGTATKQSLPSGEDDISVRGFVGCRHKKQRKEEEKKKPSTSPRGIQACIRQARESQIPCTVQSNARPVLPECRRYPAETTGKRAEWHPKGSGPFGNRPDGVVRRPMGEDEAAHDLAVPESCGPCGTTACPLFHPPAYLSLHPARKLGALPAWSAVV
ncbi:hypothetical protein GQ53DRAFT_426599 [Thozetella sp. PMI_491]|nr:hypothetical protein GQ53DRAFT_426599 [Thozetella sp. PMI_491]